MNASSYPETKLCKSRQHVHGQAGALIQESTWINALLRDGELECPDDRFSVVLLLFILRTYLIESVSVQQRPLILGNALGLS